ncbi:MAG: preprotein translocase subunit SecE [Patescibacteria group bacterium]
MAPNPITYVKESKAEFDKVIWPTRLQTLKLTATVTIGSLIIGAYIAGLDAILTKITETFLR